MDTTDVVEAKPFRRGRWKPGEIDYRTKVIIGVCLSVEAVLRGADYILVDPEYSVAGILVDDSLMDDSLAITTWGALFLSAGIGLVAGFMLKWGALIIGACLLGGASYVSLAIGVYATHESFWPAIRLPGMYLTFAVCWFTIAWATFEKLRRWAVLAAMQEGVNGGIPSD